MIIVSDDPKLILNEVKKEDVIEVKKPLKSNLNNSIGAKFDLNNPLNSAIHSTSSNNHDENNNTKELKENHEKQQELDKTEENNLSNELVLLYSQRNNDFINVEFINKLETIMKNLIFRLYKCFEKELTSQSNFGQEEIDTLKRNKNFINFKTTAERAIIFSCFKIAYNNFTILFEMAKYNSDYLLCAKAKEGIAAALTLYDLLKTYKKDIKHFNTQELVFSEDIVENLESGISYIKKTKIPELFIDMLFKFVFYLMFFENKLKTLLEYEKKISEELNQYTNPEFKIFCYLKLKYIFEFTKFRRRSIYYVYSVYKLLQFLIYLFKLLYFFN